MPYNFNSSPNHSPAFAKFLRSNDWAEARQRRLEHDNYTCQYRTDDCLGPFSQKLPLTSLEVHHLRYERFADCLQEDLVTVCTACHDHADLERMVENAGRRWIKRVLSYMAPRVQDMVEVKIDGKWNYSGMYDVSDLKMRHAANNQLLQHIGPDGDKPPQLIREYACRFVTPVTCTENSRTAAVLETLAPEELAAIKRESDAAVRT